MAENSKIEWTDHTFNPWEGCVKVSDGCKNCYAANRAKRFGTVEWGLGVKRRRTSAANWKKPLKWNREAEKLGVRYKVFCASLADVCEIKNDQPEIDWWRNDLGRLILETPNLDWLILTKRPENFNELFGYMFPFGFPKNIWIGTSIENQEQADKRIPELLNIPAKVRFLSMEPLLGPVDLSNFQPFLMHNGEKYTKVRGILSGAIDWVIVGGESGADARPMHPKWARSIRDQCIEADVPFLFKQWGEWHPDCICGRSKACRTINRPREHLSIMFRCGKHAGRKLDGWTWNEFPNLNGNE